MRVLPMTENDRSRLPIACSLPLAEGGRRVAQWRALADDYLLERSRTPETLTLRYAPVDDARARLSRLAEAERDCCSYVDWTVETGPGALRLIVTGTEDALTSLLFLE